MAIAPVYPTLGYFIPQLPSEDTPEAQPMAYRVLIVEDHVLLAEALGKALGDEADIDIVASVATVAAARRTLEVQPVDVALLDFHLPDGDGLLVAKHILKHYPRTRVVMLTARDDRKLLMEALDAGCTGFLTKGESLVHLPSAIRAASTGTTSLSPVMTRRLLEKPGTSGPASDALVPREVEILQLLASGQSSTEIAGQLFITQATLRNHLARINQKLGTHSKVEALTKALRMGLIDVPVDNAS